MDFMKFDSGAFMKICQESPDLSSSMKDFVPQQDCKVNTFLCSNIQEYFAVTCRSISVQM